MAEPVQDAYEADPDRRRDLLQDIHLALWRSFERSYELGLGMATLRRLCGADHRVSCSARLCTGRQTTEKRSSAPRGLCEDALHHVAGDAGETRVETLVLDRQALVIDAEQMQHRRMEVGDGHRIFDSGVT